MTIVSDHTQNNDKCAKAQVTQATSNGVDVHNRNFLLPKKLYPELSLDKAPPWFADCVSATAEEAEFPVGGVAIAALGAMSAATVGNFGHQTEHPVLTSNVGGGKPTGLLVSIVSPYQSGKSFVGEIFQQSHKQADKVLRGMQASELARLTEAEGPQSSEDRERLEFLSKPVVHTFHDFTPAGAVKWVLNRHYGSQVYANGDSAFPLLQGWANDDGEDGLYSDFFSCVYEGDKLSIALAHGRFTESDPRAAATFMCDSSSAAAKKVFTSKLGRATHTARFLFHYRPELAEPERFSTREDRLNFALRRLAVQMSIMVMRYWADSKSICDPKPLRSESAPSPIQVIEAQPGIRRLVSEFRYGLQEERERFERETGKLFNDSDMRVLGRQPDAAARIAAILAAFESLVPQVESYIAENSARIMDEDGHPYPLSRVLTESELQRFEVPQNIQYTEEQYQFGLEIAKYSRENLNLWREIGSGTADDYLADRVLTNLVRVNETVESGKSLPKSWRRFVTETESADRLENCFRVGHLIRMRVSGSDPLRDREKLSESISLLVKAGCLVQVGDAPEWFTLNWGELERRLHPSARVPAIPQPHSSADFANPT